MNELDFPIMIERLNKELTTKQISEITGIPTSTINSVKLESCDIPKGWNQGLNLLDLYLKFFGIPVPLLYEHNEVKK